MPFRKEWRRLITEPGRPNRRLYETAVFATLRDKLRAGDIWVERSSNYRRFDSYLLPPAAVPAIAAELGLPATADEWLDGEGRRTRPPAETLRATAAPRSSWKVSNCATAACMSPRSRRRPRPKPSIGRRDRGDDAARAHHRIAARSEPGEPASPPLSPICAPARPATSENALLAAILADATNLGLARMAAASHGVTRDKLIWTADAYIRPETYKRRSPGSSMRTMRCRSPRSGATAELLLGSAILPLRQARRRRRRDQRALRARSRPRLLHPRLGPARPLQQRASCRRPATKRHTCSMG